VRFSHKRGFPGESIMIEFIFGPMTTIPPRSSIWRHRDLGTILADSVVLLQTPAVSRAY
jgi:hypothetical protein